MSSTPPITLADAKAHMNILDSTDDAVITAKLAAATEYIEGYIGKLFDNEEDFPDGIPEPLKEAVRQITAHFYENREPVLVGVNAQELPFNVFDIMNGYRKWVF